MLARRQPVRPLEYFVAGWSELLASASPGLRLAAVGGGAGGVELALAARHRLQAPGPHRPGEHRALTGEPLRSYRPQRRTPCLLATGPRRAIVSWGGIVAVGAWAWRWKELIDRRFLRQYQLSHSN